MIDPPGGFVSGGTYAFQLAASKDGVDWNLAGSTVVLYLKKRGRTVLTKPATLTATTNVAVYTTTTGDLTAGAWLASWKVTQSSIEVESEADSFNVAPSLG